MTRFFISGALLRTALLAGTVALVAAGCAAAEEPSSTAAPASDGTGTTAASVAEETTTTAAPAPTDRGSREAPIAAGESVVVGDWEVTVLSAIPNATEAVLTENQFNDPPADGRQFYIVEVAATYQGDASEAIFAGLTITTVGDAAVAYENFEDTCGVIPNELDTFSEVFPGGTQTGNLCWSVRSDDATSLVLIVDHALSFDQDRAYLALPPEGVTFDAPVSGAAGPEGGDAGSRGNPYPLGESVVVGDWEVTVLSAIPNATEAVLTENQFNDPPADGRQFYIVEVAATYQGDASEAIFAGLTITTVGDAAVAYENFEDTCGVIPNELDTFSEVFPGGTQTGNLCWSVRSDDATSLVLIVDHALSFDQDRAYLALVP